MDARMIKIVWPWFIRTFRPKPKPGKVGVTATTFLPFVVIFKDKETANDPITVNHEAIHGRQMIELFWIGMGIVILWCKITGRDNPFEKECYANQKNLQYLKTRKRHSWKKY